MAVKNESTILKSSNKTYKLSINDDGYIVLDDININNGFPYLKNNFILIPPQV
jgi:hypothetical protein